MKCNKSNRLRTHGKRREFSNQFNNSIRVWFCFEICVAVLCLVSPRAEDGEDREIKHQNDFDSWNFPVRKLHFADHYLHFETWRNRNTNFCVHNSTFINYEFIHLWSWCKYPAKLAKILILSYWKFGVMKNKHEKFFECEIILKSVQHQQHHRTRTVSLWKIMLVHHSLSSLTQCKNIEMRWLKKSFFLQIYWSDNRIWRFTHLPKQFSHFYLLLSITILRSPAKFNKIK